MEIKLHPITQQPRNFCFIIFDTEQQASSACQQLHYINKQPVSCIPCKPSHEIQTIRKLKSKTLSKLVNQMEPAFIDLDSQSRLNLKAAKPTLGQQVNATVAQSSALSKESNHTSKKSTGRLNLANGAKKVASNKQLNSSEVDQDSQHRIRDLFKYSPSLFAESIFKHNATETSNYQYLDNDINNAADRIDIEPVAHLIEAEGP